MADSMYGWCSSAPYNSGNHHARKAIGHHRINLKYFVVWVCDQCAATWWLEDSPPAEVTVRSEPPLIDGCRIASRGDGNYVCNVHNRYWPMGSGICPGRQGR